MRFPCDQLDVWLGRYRDGELSDRARLEAEQHLDACDACRDRLRQLDGLGEALREAMDDALDPFSERILNQRIHASLEDTAAVRAPTFRAGRVASAWAAAAVLLAALGVFALRATEGNLPIPIASERGAPVHVKLIHVDPAVRNARLLEAPDEDFQVVWIGTTDEAGR